MATAAVEEPMVDGTEFEGKAVVAASVEIPNVAGGLRDAMKFGWAHFEHGEEWCLVLKGRVKKVRHDPDDKDDYAGDLVRVHILDCEEGTFIDESVVADALGRQRAIIAEGKRREEESRGTQRLNLKGGDGDTEYELALAHANGDHKKKPIAGCVVCQASEPEPEGEEESERIVLTRRHLQGVHSDGLRDGCPVCDVEKRADAEEQGS